MTYWALNAVFLGAIAAVAIAGLLTDRIPRWGAVAITLAALLVTTAIFDNVMIGVGLVAYDPAHISGIRLGLAPLEDFAYAVAAALLLPVLWHLLPGRHIRSEENPSRATGPAGESGPSAQNLLASDSDTDGRRDGEPG